MTDLAMWSALAGAITPPALAVFQQPRFPGWARVLVMAVGSCIVALVTASMQGKLNWSRWEHSLLVVGVLAISTYHGGWKPSGIAPAIEKATAKTPPSAPPAAPPAA